MHDQRFFAGRSMPVVSLALLCCCVGCKPASEAEREAIAKERANEEFLAAYKLVTENSGATWPSGESPSDAKVVCFNSKGELFAELTDLVPENRRAATADEAAIVLIYSQRNAVDRNFIDASTGRLSEYTAKRIKGFDIKQKKFLGTANVNASSMQVAVQELIEPWVLREQEEQRLAALYLEHKQWEDLYAEVERGLNTWPQGGLVSNDASYAYLSKMSRLGWMPLGTLPRSTTNKANVPLNLPSGERICVYEKGLRPIGIERSLIGVPEDVPIPDNRLATSHFDASVIIVWEFDNSKTKRDRGHTAYYYELKGVDLKNHTALQSVSYTKDEIDLSPAFGSRLSQSEADALIQKSLLEAKAAIAHFFEINGLADGS